MTDARDTADWFGRAAVELRGTSELQTAWAAGVADDPEVVGVIATLPREHRQPSLLFSVANLLGAPAGGYPEWRAWLLDHWHEVAAQAAVRRTQTNEPGRCAALLAALARIPGPIALLELGAAAGLCLLPDRYSYRYDRGDTAGQRLGEGDPLLVCHTSGDGLTPDALPDIVWRRGIDLAPLSPQDPADRAWLEALLPPDRPERRARLRAALAAAGRADAPAITLVAGDALAELHAQARLAPASSTLVVVALGTLVYLSPAARAGILDAVPVLGARLVTLEPVTALPSVADAIAGRTAPETTPFLLALDADPIAYVSAHGDRLSWLSAGQPGVGSAAA